jgi:beta-glucanase (GH16 family)
MLGLAVVLVLIAGGATVGILSRSGPAPGPTSHHAPPSALQSPPAPTAASTPTTSPTPTPAPTPTPRSTLSPSRAAGSAGPSGQAMPTGNLPGWRMVFSDDFAGPALNTDKWGTYQYQPGGDPGGWWDPSHVVVSNGVLNLESYVDPAHANPQNPGGYVSGGVSSGPGLKQTYGKYLVRFRIDQGYGIAGVLLLWPTNDAWPPEIDFAEDGGGSRDHMTATLHYGKDDSQIAQTVYGDFTQWHTLGVEWTQGKLVFTIDGRDWWSLTNRNVPAEPMELDIQTQAGTCGNQADPCPDSSTPARVDMQVGWVVAYAPA